ncbi:predicted protein [Histoplasma capsulatum G186AR]|uniref:Uncharacterized protein n=1 Tax=Ajellomyces capsulatus (strain G186AR / H82 / ATCC MYA-2454 / RMSCC 2432) TaxID=447093 RepID=C0NI52_AJECG|nr:uncharacterized protein HCBG_03024 [Histoplasma capsulatum G186AR]EEH09487.1 predicted protein [Histoplasma capsulatum G186AR]
MRRILAARPDHTDNCFFSAPTWGSTRTSAGSLWAGSTQSFRDGAACSKPVGDDLRFVSFFRGKAFSLRRDALGFFFSPPLLRVFMERLISQSIQTEEFKCLQITHRSVGKDGKSDK